MTKKKRDIEIMDIFDMEIDVANDAARRRELGQVEKYNFFEIMLEYCFFENNDRPAKVMADVLKSRPGEQLDDSMIRADQNLQFRSP